MCTHDFNLTRERKMTETTESQKNLHPAVAVLVIVLGFLASLGSYYSESPLGIAVAFILIPILEAVFFYVMSPTVRRHSPMIIGIGVVFVILGIVWIEKGEAIRSLIPTPVPFACAGVTPVGLVVNQENTIASADITIKVMNVNGTWVAEEVTMGQSYWPMVETWIFQYPQECRGYVETTLIPSLISDGMQWSGSVSPTQTPTAQPTSPATPTTTETQLPPQP
jgi:hypothetical protein